VALPHRAQGYPAIMQDLKGLKVGITARGSGGEAFFNAMLREAGMVPQDVTYVGVGGPSTAYASLVVGRQIDAVVMFQPLTQLCLFNKTCATVVDMTQGEGPQAIQAMNGASVPFVMHRETVTQNPGLVAAFYAAMRETAAWFGDPANFEALDQIYKPLISFGDLPGADEMRREWIRSVVPAYSKDLAVPRPSVQAIIDFYVEAKVLEKRIAAADLVWEKAP
jgi:NitT/TauT family transport system substrate-binding protein